MKQTISLLLLLFVLTSCDGVRSFLGMATSKDIEKAKIELAKEELLRKHRADSIAAIRDSIQRANLIAEQPMNKDIKGRYFVIAGSFKEESNVTDMENTLKKYGVNPVVLEFKNGFHLVGMGGYDTYSVAHKELTRLEEADFSSFDIWIYDKNQDLHIK